MCVHKYVCPRKEKMNLNFVENFARIRVYPTDVQIFLFSLFLTHSGDIEISIGLKWINELLD